MKKLFKSYTSFTRTERIGLLCLCALLIIFIIIRATMSLWVHPVTDTEKEKKLAAAWDTIKRSQPKEVNDTDEKIKIEYKNTTNKNEAPLRDIIDLNTADSATLLRIKGIDPATAGRIVAYRAAHGPFTSIDQLLHIPNLPAATFDILKKHLVINKTR
jgi:DNA uptake protein ComE-like DNA-binding protein